MYNDFIAQVYFNSLDFLNFHKGQTQEYPFVTQIKSAVWLI